MNIVVYSAIFGDIDKLWTAETNGVRHVVFTDSPKVEYDLPKGGKTANPVWEQIVLPPGWDMRRSARHYKTVPQYYMPEADIWVWVDCNVRLKIAPQLLVEQYLHEDFATFKHPDRDCLYVEADFCAKSHKDRPEVLKKQTDRYRKEGMPQHWGLIETRVVIRRNTPKVCELNTAWWDEIESNSLRDQVSLPYVFWKHGWRWETIPGRCGPVRPVGPFIYIGHKA